MSYASSIIGILLGIIIFGLGIILLFGPTGHKAGIIILIGIIIFILSSYNLYKLYKKDNDNNN